MAGFWVRKSDVRRERKIGLTWMKINWNWLEGKNFESESRGWYEKMILRLLCGSWSWDHLTIYFQHIFPCLVCHCSFITSYMLFIWMCSWQCSCWDNTTWGESGIGSLLKAMNMAKNTGKRWKFISLSALSFLCKLLGSCTLLIFFSHIATEIPFPPHNIRKKLH